MNPYEANWLQKSADKAVEWAQMNAIVMLSSELTIWTTAAREIIKRK